MPQLHYHLPNFRDGIPSLLESIHAGRYKDPELVELLLTQGLMVSSELGDSFFTRLFERWSRFKYTHAAAEESAIALAEVSTSADAGHLDIRDSLNLLAGLFRSQNPEVVKMGEMLEQ